MINHYYIVHEDNSSYTVDGKTGAVVDSTPAGLLAGGETFWMRDSRMSALESWCKHLNKTATLESTS